MARSADGVADEQLSVPQESAGTFAQFAAPVESAAFSSPPATSASPRLPPPRTLTTCEINSGAPPPLPPCSLQGSDSHLDEKLPARTWCPFHFATRSPGSRVFPSAVMHDSLLYIFGGHDGTVYRDDLLVLDLEMHAWKADLLVSGAAPSPRDAHAAVVNGDYMYVFGGYDSKRYLNDFHSFHFASAKWSRVMPASGDAPTPRGGHTAVVFQGRVLIFGGCDGWNYFNDAHNFTFARGAWDKVRVTGTAPGARSAPATVVHEPQAAMFVFGGYDGTRSLNDLFRFDLHRSEWSHVRVSGTPPSPRGGHTAVVYGDHMYTFGGKSGRSPFNDLCAFDFERQQWSAVDPGLPDPAPRCAHVCIVHGSSLFVFGGYDGRRYFDDCFEFAFEVVSSASVLGLSGDLGNMVNNEQFSDIAFLVEGRTVHSHKFILFARCEYFRRMFTSGYKESTDAVVRIEDVAHDAFVQVLTFLYTGQVRELAPALALDVMGLANLYGIEPLKRLCADAACRELSIENAAVVLAAAESYQVTQLRSTCISFMVSHFADVVRTEAFKQLMTKESSGLVVAFLEEASSKLSLGERPTRHF